MIHLLRDNYNAQFNPTLYNQYCASFEEIHPNAIEFRLAETPIFVDKNFKEKMLSTCEYIVDEILKKNFTLHTNAALPPDFIGLNEKKHPECMVFDFGVCGDEMGEICPQLIEMQGFPSLFAFQVLQDKMCKKYMDIPENYTAYFNNLDENSYILALKNMILGNLNPENVVLLELYPHKQKTRVDFYCTKDYVGINLVCLTEIIIEGNALFYMHPSTNKKTAIYKIYNRIILDELNIQSTNLLQKALEIFKNNEIDFIPHPNWFYRISKFTLPFLKHPYIPQTQFLDKVENIPADLENYVLKPLFSFAGQGVIIHVKKADIDNIKNKSEWILQKKVNYLPIIKTPDIPAKVEIRVFYFWQKNDLRPMATSNLVRLSKGDMIGVRYNKDKEWVGGSIAYFQKN